MLKYLWIAVVVLLLDQASKWFADQQLTLYTPVEVIPDYFNFMLAYNEGAAFSFLSEAGGWQRWFFSALAAGVSVVLVVWMKRLQPGERLTAVALSLILGGAIGNLLDRLMHGHVVDFIQWYVGDFYWPAFNIADSAISVGAVLLILHALFSKQDEAR